MSNNYHEALSLAAQDIVNSVPAVDSEPVEFSSRHNSAMNKLFSKMKSGKYHSHSSKEIVKVVAVAAAVFSITLTVIGRPSTKPYKITDYNLYSSYEIIGDYEILPVKDMKLGYIPPGFEITEENRDKFLHKITYESGNRKIELIKQPLDIVCDFDSENSAIEIVKANGIDYVCQYRDAYCSYMWNDGQYLFNVCSWNVDSEESFKVAKNLK